uniref:NADH-ubiquinone oxidoreductase chain 3 n=1 Tax=Leptopilina syphax TaxID=2755057 RepID=A0A7D6J9N3_9HYME|nr:NADH dehydrogenase subunit 3 [Leptopilina syphax]
MYMFIILNIIVMILGGVIMGVNLVLSKKMYKCRNKMSSFECGFDPMSYSKVPFSIQFYLISIIFLIFDVEITLILPSIILIQEKWFFYKYIFCVIMLILVLGLYYEFKEGSLNWF